MIDKNVATEPRNWATDLLRHRSVQLAIALWAGAVVAVFLIAHGSLPFSRPSLTGDPVVGPLLLSHAGLLEELGLIALTVFLTRKRRIPDMASRAPAASVNGKHLRSTFATKEIMCTRAGCASGSSLDPLAQPADAPLACEKGDFQPHRQADCPCGWLERI